MNDLNEIEKILDENKKKSSKRKQTNDAEQPASPVSSSVERKYYLDSIDVKVVRTADDVVMPKYAHDGDACVDLRAYDILEVIDANGNVRKIDNFEYVTLYKGYIVKFRTGLKFDLPDGWSGDILIRSGISSNEGLVLMNGKGEVDTTYNGEIIVAIGKINNFPTTIRKNDRIAQFKPMRQTYMNLTEVDSFEKDIDNQRGEAGFGSSGRN